MMDPSVIAEEGPDLDLEEAKALLSKMKRRLHRSINYFYIIVEGDGFRSFCLWHRINDLPVPQSVSGSALRDVYLYAEGQIKEIKKTPKF
jgi:hypothetical protein